MRNAAYITRAEHWSFEYRERSPITKSEWLTYVQSDPKLKLLEFIEGSVIGTGEVVGIRVRDTYEWIAHPLRPVPEAPATFEFNRGGVIVRSPDPHLMRKAVQVAISLRARVINDSDQVVI